MENNTQYIPLEHVDATCPHCKSEMEITLPEGVIYKNPDFDIDGHDLMIAAKRKIDMNKAVLENFEILLRRVEGFKWPWIGRKTRSFLIRNIKSLQELQTHIIDNEYYPLYNKFNPSVGEHS